MAALVLPCCAWTFSSCLKLGLLFSLDVQASHCSGFSCCGAQTLGAWAPVVVACGLSSCGSWIYVVLWGWNLPGPGIEPVSPALQSGFLTTGLPAKPLNWQFLSRSHIRILSGASEKKKHYMAVSSVGGCSKYQILVRRKEADKQAENRTVPFPLRRPGEFLKLLPSWPELSHVATAARKTKQ